MYAIRIIGPSGFVQYSTGNKAIPLSTEFEQAEEFNTEDDANYCIDNIDRHLMHGRIVEVINLDDES